MIVLNTPHSPEKLSAFWAAPETYWVCADGGADRLRQSLPEAQPQLIVGDLDSITPDTMEHFQTRGVPIRDLSADQDTTDVEKALVAVQERGCPSAVIAANFHSGRVDHFFGIINALFKHAGSSSGIKEAVVVSDDAVMRLLQPGDHSIGASVGSHCGLVPFAVPEAQVTTRGLRWNLDDGTLAYGALISTSNIVDEPEVKVTTSAPLLWTMTFSDDR